MNDKWRPSKVLLYCTIGEFFPESKSTSHSIIFILTSNQFYSELKGEVGEFIGILTPSILAHS